MYKRISLFLLIVLLVLCAFSGTTIYCYNMLVNNEKVENSSVYANLLEGWNNTLGTTNEVLNKEYFIEPIGEVMFATDANNNYMYAYEDGERFKMVKTDKYAKDKDGNYLYASAGDASYITYYYATSCDSNYEFMYAHTYEYGEQYFTFKNINEDYRFLTNEKGQKLVTGNEEKNNIDDVKFSKDAKLYYVIILCAMGLGLIVLISLLVTFITGKVKERKNG